MIRKCSGPGLVLLLFFGAPSLCRRKWPLARRNRFMVEGFNCKVPLHKACPPTSVLVLGSVGAGVHDEFAKNAPTV